MIKLESVPVFGATDETDCANIEQQMSVLCASLEKIIVGRDAKKILDTTVVTDSSALVVLPAWNWQLPAINVGRKNKSQSGDLLMPVRVSWTKGSVVVVPEGTTEAAVYSLCGLGNNGSGIVSITGEKSFSPVLRCAAKVDGQVLPANFTAANGTAASVRQQLQKLVAEGTATQWELMMKMDSWSKSIFYKAVCAIVNEMGLDEGSAKKLINDFPLREELRSAYILGTEEKESPALKLIERCMVADTFAKVDPILYVTTSIRENAERSLRVAIDDPRTGRKVRNIARELNTRNPDEVLEVYRARFPKERTGRKLVVRALSPAPSLDFHSLSELDLAALSHQADLYGNPTYR